MEIGKRQDSTTDVILVFTPWDAPQWWMKYMATTHPSIEVRWVNSTAPDRSLKRPEDTPLEIWDGVTILCTYEPPPAHLLRSVRFVQLTSAGSDMWVGHPTFEDEKVVFCTSNGIQPPQIAEWVIGSWLSFSHHFAKYAQDMKTGTWEAYNDSPVTDSLGARMGILGYGAIGRQCAKLGQALGMEIFAYTRTEKATPASRRDNGYNIPGTGDPEGVIPAKWFHGTSKETINDFLSQGFDILVLCLPLTSETRNLLSAEQFALLSRKKTFVSNVSRGPLIDQKALIDALTSGQIRGAALDVADPEPLPADHPLWKAPNLLITPHVSWKSVEYWTRLLDLFGKNLERMTEGKPLLNSINRKLK
ncbi:D-isomer specific 2-hydroxyacid dehydrogenase [Stachybotrys elegans]|uniref:D-isomer specific 2-hydroxyacid dehydrogenase n=1 Tax=Stachybotrys elegans TaxID=80388 RepID=A0A8K0SQF6_9HYPO|nr:D-isomer specific 2-hydroxyacid dehydrogenase [Stachybotrys elegans]